MVDVTEKAVTDRTALARGSVTMSAETLALVAAGGHKKGDVITLAKIAGIQAAKRCAELIPLCHPLLLTHISVDCEINTAASCVDITATCRVTGQTGIEMEALTAVSVAALTIYDMCKAVDKDMQIDGVRLLEKTGGRSGHWQAQT